MVDTLFYNGKFYSLEKEGECFKALSIKNGKIIQLFEENPVNLKSKNRVDFNGKTIIPGLIDTHIHLMPTAYYLALGFSMSELHDKIFLPSDLKGVKDKLQKYTSQKKFKYPILCTNYIISTIKENRLPTIRELDNWLPGFDVIIISSDGHSSSYSSSILKKIGISTYPEKGIYDNQNHVDTLKILEKYMFKRINLRLILSGIEKTINQAITYGIVSLHCLEGLKNDIKDLSLFTFKLIAPYLPLYIRLYAQIQDVYKLKKWEKKLQNKRIGGCGFWEIDGSVSSRNAAFYTNYKNSKDHGEILYKEQDLIKNIEKAYNHGYQVTSHAIGTKAIDQLLNSYESILMKNNDSKNQFRFRIDHYDFPSSEAVIKSTKLQILHILQPGFYWMDREIKQLNMYKKTLNSSVLKLKTPLKKIIQNGGIICGSSDSPVQSLNPFIQIHGMVNYPIKEERISVYEALRSYTYYGAFATFEEDLRGTLKKGKYADFIVLKNDPFKIPKEEVINLKVESTYIKGKKVNKIKLTLFKLIMNNIFRKKAKF